MKSLLLHIVSDLYNYCPLQNSVFSIFSILWLSNESEDQQEIKSETKESLSEQEFHLHSGKFMLSSNLQVTIKQSIISQSLFAVLPFSPFSCFHCTNQALVMRSASLSTILLGYSMVL